MENQFKHFISLGYFCSVAEELEKLGLRSESSPFDWVISDFSGVMRAIENRFEGLLAYESLYQSTRNRGLYKNKAYEIAFYHDFTPYVSLKEQLPGVQEKYNRRILRFYHSISEPTLFFRYISDEEMCNGVSSELLWIEENHEKILAVLKQFHQGNEIVYIANNGVFSDKITIYNVPRGEHDTVCRTPFHSNAQLYSQCQSFEFQQREENLLRYQRKTAQKNSLSFKVKRKLQGLKNKYFSKEYIHNQQY